MRGGSGGWRCCREDGGRWERRRSGRRSACETKVMRIARRLAKKELRREIAEAQKELRRLLALMASLSDKCR